MTDHEVDVLMREAKLPMTLLDRTGELFRSRTLRDAQRESHWEGWTKCIDAVRASLCAYPNGGGDIGIMTEVERIANERATSLQDEIKQLKARIQGLLEACNVELERRRKAEMDLEMARLDTQHWQRLWQEAVKEKEEDPICPV